MFKTKTNLVVILNVFDSDALHLSVPPLGRMGRGFTLVIYNDNPNQKIQSRTIRRMGWHGPLHIINSDKNYGECESRLNAVKSLRELGVPGDWLIFLDQDDALLDITIPDVSENVFAIVQNATTISDNITDIFKITPSWVMGCEYGKTGPHFEITGTILRRVFIDEFADFMTEILPKLYRDLRRTRYRVPVSQLLWLALKVFMQIRHPDLAPIYMNRTNYVEIKMGRTPIKYGRRIPNCAKANKIVADTMAVCLGTVRDTAKILASRQ